MTRRPAPRFPYEAALDRVAKGFDVSLAFVGAAKAKSLNQNLRGKDYVPNVLSYATSKTSGEIVICLTEAKRQAPAYDLSYAHFVGFLFIHGLMHLKGHRHGHTMDKMERTHLARLLAHSPSTNETTHRNRNRHRHAPDARGRRRGSS